jgi:hypothetical protein
MRSNQLNPVFLLQLPIQALTVVGLVANNAFGQFVKKAVPEDFFDELTFMRRSALHANGERQTVTIGDSDDLSPLASARGTDRKAPFFALAKVASMNVS